MLRITADVYSGRENPSWVVTDPAEVTASLSEIARQGSMMAAQEAQEGNLGELRGFYVDISTDQLAADNDLGSSLYLPIQPGSTGSMRDLAMRFLSLASEESLAMGLAANGLGEEEGTSPEMLRGLLGGMLNRQTGSSEPDASPAAVAEETTEMVVEAAPAVTCVVDYAAYNPNFWNSDPTVRSKNNCYNYASNKRTDTFAQPGRGCGNMYKTITCAEVTRPALCDRLHKRYVCIPTARSPATWWPSLWRLVPASMIFIGIAKTRKGFGATNQEAHL